MITGGYMKARLAFAILVAVPMSSQLVSDVSEIPTYDAAKASQAMPIQEKEPKAQEARPRVAAVKASGADGSIDRDDAAGNGKRIEITVQSGDTLVELMQRNGVDTSTALAVGRAFEAASSEPLQPGNRIQLVFTARTRLARLSLKSGGDRRVEVERTKEGTYAGRTGEPNHQTDLVHKHGEIQSSLLQALRDTGVPAELSAKVANVLGQRIDLQRDLRRGDRFEVAYERLTDSDTGSSHPGRLRYVEFDGARSGVAAYRFNPGDGTAFFDRTGRSLRTGFLRTPVDGARLSSSFGARDHPVLDYSRKHEGLDYAAPRGTPVMAVSDGVVERASRYSSFGNFVRLRHGSGLTSAYAHLSRYADGLDKGDRVEQGEVIGYVGATGLATGPNLHYEVQRDGTPIKPATRERPPQQTLDGTQLERFQDIVASMKNRLRLAHAKLNPEIDIDPKK